MTIRTHQLHGLASIAPAAVGVSALAQGSTQPNRHRRSDDASLRGFDSGADFALKRKDAMTMHKPKAQVLPAGLRAMVRGAYLATSLYRASSGPDNIPLFAD